MPASYVYQQQTYQVSSGRVGMTHQFIKDRSEHFQLVFKCKDNGFL